ncbi:hypothetical protein AciX9_1845 [Granulicella tundricola MP5ACTX9]|uniref:Uncharacterized protein n=1 Tax=Granulicella tundricola (strain ATCC BAA-1859 / DSM 23138 / MP5ACTX9) TaxID=1198114 RepID=E8WZZ5_GRATM|nr:hypothetical protein [Granulicella tundricola]ADW68891.1 hypothetical protein AciX9_1845 [Granulicella tundricola MP5ACTX9]
MTNETTASARYQCRHIHTDGRRCGSPTLRHEHFCYYHHTTRKPIPRADLEARYADQNRCAPFDLPIPEDRAAIQLAIGEILRRIAANQLDNRRAGLLLYGLQIAATNLPPQRQPATEPKAERELVEDTVQDPTHGTLAPEAEYAAPKGEKTLEQILKERWAEDKEAAAEKARLHPPAPERPDYVWSDEEEGLVLKAVAETIVAATSPKPAPTKSALVAFIPCYPRNLSPGTSTISSTLIQPSLRVQRSPSLRKVILRQQRSQPQARTQQPGLRRRLRNPHRRSHLLHRHIAPMPSHNDVPQQRRQLAHRLAQLPHLLQPQAHRLGTRGRIGQLP